MALSGARENPKQDATGYIRSGTPQSGHAVGSEGFKDVVGHDRREGRPSYGSVEAADESKQATLGQDRSGIRSVDMLGKGQSRLPGLWTALAVAFLCTALSLVILQSLLVTRGHTSVSAAQAAAKLDEPYARFFHKTVLVVNVNYEAVAENTTVFWRKYYSRFFRHIVVLCKRPLPHIGVEGEWSQQRVPRCVVGGVHAREEVASKVLLTYSGPQKAACAGRWS